MTDKMKTKACVTSMWFFFFLLHGLKTAAGTFSTSDIRWKVQNKTGLQVCEQPAAFLCIQAERGTWGPSRWKARTPFDWSCCERVAEQSVSWASCVYEGSFRIYGHKQSAASSIISMDKAFIYNCLKHDYKSLQSPKLWGTKILHKDENYKETWERLSNVWGR